MTDARATVAEAIAATLKAHGVKRTFGIPGGGSSLELIDAFARQDIGFVLCHTETAAAIMAAVTAELTGVPGVVLTGLGPGAASVVNGVAYAWLDRAPLLVVTDSYRPGSHDFITHQTLDHAAMFAPITKARGRGEPANAVATLAALLDTALAHPRGPVHLDLSAGDALARTAGALRQRPAAPEPAVSGDLAAARRLIDGARRPAIVAGLDSRAPAAAAALHRLAARLACPVLTTYKAKGVVPQDHAYFAGMFTGGKSEAPWLAEADLMILFGVDPVELIASPWPYRMDVLELAETVIRPHYMTPAASLFGPLATVAACVDGAGRATNWSGGAPPAGLTEQANGARGPQTAITALIRAAPKAARLTCDSGIHMLPAMASWPARAAHDCLISNGLSTMGFALPAAIASALADRGRPAVAVIGDGGLAMCLAELATLAREQLPVTVIVFNDAALSMIDVKQQQRGFASIGVRYPALDFARIAEGAGLRAWRVGQGDDLDHALAAAFSHGGPGLVDVAIDPLPYRAQIEAVRGRPAASQQS